MKNQHFVHIFWYWAKQISTYQTFKRDKQPHPNYIELHDKEFNCIHIAYLF